MPTTTVRERPSRLRAGVLVAGELLITGGVVLLLFAVYLVVGTSWETASDQRAAGAELDRVWSEPAPAAGPGAAPGSPPASGAAVPPPRAQGEPLLRMYVPRFGPRWEFTVLEGTGADVLARGPGHYPGTALPGEVGNAAVAGHRVTRASPFDAAGELRACDPVVLETRDRWLVYAVLPPAGEPACPGAPELGPEYAGVAGTEIVPPSERGVIAPVPGRPGLAPSARLLTLTTCHPRFSARERLIVHSVLVREQPKDAGRPAELEV